MQPATDLPLVRDLGAKRLLVPATSPQGPIPVASPAWDHRRKAQGVATGKRVVSEHEAGDDPLVVIRDTQTDGNVATSAMDLSVAKGQTSPDHEGLERAAEVMTSMREIDPVRASTSHTELYAQAPRNTQYGGVTNAGALLNTAALQEQPDIPSTGNSDATRMTGSGSGWLGWPALLGGGLLVGLAAKGKGGSNPADTAVTPTPTGLAFTLEGVIMAGPMIKSMRVTAYDAQGVELGSVLTDSTDFGHYAIKIASTQQFKGGAVLLRVADPSAGNDYIDEATHQGADVTDLRALIYVDSATTSNQSTVKAYITPLSTLAAERLAPLPALVTTQWTLANNTITGADISQTNKQVAALFGLASDVTQLKPEAVITADGKINANSNAYGKALAVLSYVQAADTTLSIQALASAVRTSETTTNGASTTVLAFNDSVASRMQTASLKAVQSHYLTTQEANAIQLSTAGTPTRAVDFRFLNDSLDLGTLDPAQALGQSVYQVVMQTKSPATSDAAPSSSSLFLVNVDNTNLRFSLEGTDASAFQFDATTGQLTLASNQAPVTQVKGGKTYELTLKATADVFGTADTADDISVAQRLQLRVVDTTPPVQPSTPTLTFRSIAGVETVAGVTTLGRPAATSTLGFLQLGDPDEGQVAAGIRHQVTLTFSRASDASGLATVTRSWMDWLDADASKVISLTSGELSRLGDGKILVRAEVTAIDLAGNASTPVVQTAVFQLDTTVATPRVTMLTNVAPLGAVTPISGDGKVRLYDLESGARWSYTLDGGAELVGAPISTGQITLDLSALGNGLHTMTVYQTDRLGNVSATQRVNFQLELNSPTGVDAQIVQFEFYDPDNPQTQTGTDARLFQLQGSAALVKVTGVVRGALDAGERLQLGVNGANWLDISLDANLNAQGQSTWSFTPSLANGSGWLSIRLLDAYQHSTILTTRYYIHQDETVLPPPTATWLGATPIEALSGLVTAMPRVAVTGLNPHAMAQYQLDTSATPTLDEHAWSNTVPQPISDGTYYLFVRQFDILTGLASAAAEPLVVEVDTQAPSAIASDSTGLYYPPVDDVGGSNTLTAVTLADTTLIENTDLPRARTVVVYHRWNELDVGATLYMRWGHVLKTHVLTADDIGMGVAYVPWSAADILSQPGQVTLQAWTTDLAGHTSVVASRLWTVDVAGPGVPRINGWFTRSSALSSLVADVDNTVNDAEARNGVVLKLQLPLTQSDGSTPLIWANGSAGTAFKLTLFAKAPSQAWSSDQIVVARSFTLSDMSPTGLVEWTLPTSTPWSSLDGTLLDWKVQVTNNAYPATSALRVTETALSELIVDTVAPSAVSLSVSNDGLNSVSMGLKQQELAVTVGYKGMAVGDVLLFKSQAAGAATSQDIFRYQLQAGDITSTLGWGTAVIRLARVAIEQGGGDNRYGLSVDVSDAAGNSTLWNGTKPQVIVDTQRPQAPLLSVAAQQDIFLNATEDHLDITVTWPNGDNRLATDQVKWVLGGTDLTAVTLLSTSATTATFRLFKTDLGQEGVKDLRVQLVDASGNLGDYSQPLSVVLDSQPHDAPVLSLTAAHASQRFLRANSTVQLDVDDAQMVVGDTLQLHLSTLAADPAGSRILWGAPITVSQDRHQTVVLSQSAARQALGLAGLGSGEYLVTAEVTDLAGNVSQLSTPFHLVVDLDAPTNQVTAGSIQLSQHAVVDATAVAGHHREFITQVAAQTITASLGSALQSASALMGPEFLWGRILTPTTAGDAGWVDLSASVSGTTLRWDTANSGGLVAGVNVIQLQVRDQAGNRGSITEQTYVLDTVAPTNAVVAGSFHFSLDTAPTGQSATVLASDFKTRETTQTLTLDLSSTLAADPNASITWGSNQEHLWASLDNGVHWQDISQYVSNGHLSWSGVTLTASDTVLFKVMDVAGNAGPQFQQAYELDQSPPTAAVTTIRMVDDTGVDAASLRDFVTNAPVTSINFTLNHVLSNGDRVYVRLGAGATPVDITEALRLEGLFDSTVFDRLAGFVNVEGFHLLSGANTLTTWVEDQVGNVGTVLTQSYTYAPRAPALDLDGLDASSTSWMPSLVAPAAQHGVALGRDMQVENLPTGVTEVVITYNAAGNDNGANERLMIVPGFEVNLAGPTVAPVTGLHIAGISDTVKLDPWGGSELHFSKQNALGATAYFSSAEVATLLSGLRYFNSAAADTVEVGDRIFDIQLIDRATNASSTQTARLVLSAGTVVTGRDATVGSDTLQGSANDDILMGLQGDDTLSGGAGNDVLWGGSPVAGIAPGDNLFVWQRGDATSAALASQATDLIRDFHAWNGTTGDRLDVASLLENYTAAQAASLSDWITVDNNATVQGVTHSTRLTVDVNGAQAGGNLQIIELQGVALSTSSALDLVHSQLLKVL